MTEYTKLVTANLATSLRATVPMSLVRHFGLKAGDYIEWNLETKDGEIVVIVRPSKKVSA